MTAGPGTAAPEKLPGRGALWLAFAWGLAESTCFFIVPDVLSSRLVLDRAGVGFLACGCSLAGAMLGGLALYCVGQNPAAAAALLQFFDHLPGISPALIAESRAALGRDGAAALFTGFAGGIPYKLYAVQAPAAGLGLPLFLAVSAAARCARFMLVTAFAWGVGGALRRTLPRRGILIAHAVTWVLFYWFYFRRMGI